MRSDKKYWIIQSIGWSLYALLNIYINFLSEPIEMRTMLINILLSMGAFALTHLFRKIIIKGRWPSLPTSELIFRILLIAIPLAFILCIWQFILLNTLYYERETVKGIRQLFTPFMAAYIIMLCWSLLYFVWSYIENNRSQMIERLQIQNELKDLELKSIRSNLQPHFIFNSLNSIRALVKDEPDNARDAIIKLSTILRNSISSQENVVPLSKELEIVENYLHLEKIRFDERLKFRFDIDADTLNVGVPPLMLQTLTENAIKHGISMREEGGTVTIKCKIEQDVIHIQIINEGSLEQTSHEESIGFGMDASRKRLNYLYPEKSSIQINEKDGFVLVDILFPYKIETHAKN